MTTGESGSPTAVAGRGFDQPMWDGAESAESLTVRADTALYAAKAAGRDRVIGT